RVGSLTPPGTVLRRSENFRWIAALVLCAAAAGCAGGGRAVGGGAAVPGADLDARIDKLRLELAEDPRDGAVHLELARALLRAGLPGGAIRHFEEAARRRSLEGGDR